MLGGRRARGVERPVIVGIAPVGWIGARVDLVAPAVIVPAPAVRVEVRTPTVIIDRHYKHKKWKHKKWKY